MTVVVTGVSVGVGVMEGGVEPVAEPVTVGVAVGVNVVVIIGSGMDTVSVGVMGLPTVMFPFTQEAWMESPFESDSSNPLGAAWVERKAKRDVQLDLARKVMLRSVPIP